MGFINLSITFLFINQNSVSVARKGDLCNMHTTICMRCHVKIQLVIQDSFRGWTPSLPSSPPVDATESLLH